MGLQIYNTRTRREEPFAPAGDRVGMYVCGPTVYDYAHLGHAKAYVAADLVRRYLEFLGYDVLHVENLTDIEDSITQRAKKEGVPQEELTERYIRAFLEDMDRLKVRRAHRYPRVTEHVAEILEVVQDLVDGGHAYVVDGEVYMRATEEDFGRLTGRPVAETVVEELAGDDRRRGPLDFALWKRAREGEPSWDSPWGRGRPGWHVECYAMATKYLGPTFDLHGGGRDLIFPHHESEDLIARALGRGEFARTWMHNGFMAVEATPMSKSLGNFITIRDVLKDVDWEVLRFFLLKGHYRDTVDYSEAALRQAGREHQEISAAIAKVDAAQSEGEPGEDEALWREAQALREAFAEAMDRDLDTPAATAAFLAFARNLHATEAIPAATAERVFVELCQICSVLGLCEEQFEP